MKTYLQKIHGFCPFLEPVILYLAATVSGYFHQRSYESISQSQWDDSALWIDAGIVFATVFYIAFLGTHSNAYRKKRETRDALNKNRHTIQKRTHVKVKMPFIEYESDEREFVTIEDINQVASKSSD